jgi:hypothetical protein
MARSKRLHAGLCRSGVALLRVAGKGSWTTCRSAALAAPAKKYKIPARTTKRWTTLLGRASDLGVPKLKQLILMDCILTGYSCVVLIVTENN